MNLSPNGENLEPEASSLLHTFSIELAFMYMCILITQVCIK